MAKKHPPKRDHFISHILHGVGVRRMGKQSANVCITSRKIGVEIQSTIEQSNDFMYVKFYRDRNEHSMPMYRFGFLKATVTAGVLSMDMDAEIVRAINLRCIEDAIRTDKEYAQKIRALVFTNLDAAQ